MSEENKKVVFITGGAGYVGEMLCEQFSLRSDVEKIITIDKEPQSEFSKKIAKLVYVQKNLADDSWLEEVKKYSPQIVVHTAWQIRSLYNNVEKQRLWNIDGSNKVFSFVFENEFVERLVHFSTAASYSARLDNKIDHYFTEAEGFRNDDYLYAAEKKEVEEILAKSYQEILEVRKKRLKITIFRPAAITGPRGRFGKVRFGLQSALQGNLKGNFLYKIVTTLTAFVPVTVGFVRQFIHEDDVVDAVSLASFSDINWSYEAFNLTPEGKPVLGKELAKVMKKKAVKIPVPLIRLVFFIFWHLTRGKIPTGKGVWRFYSYPIVMSGEKLAKVYSCKFNSLEAICLTAGRYEEVVPIDQRVTKC